MHGWLLLLVGFETEGCNHITPCLGVFTLKVLEETAALGDLFDEAAARAEVLAVILEVRGELLNFLREQRDLHLRGASIALVGAEFLDDRVFLLLAEHNA